MSLEADDREWSGLVTWVDQATNQGAERRQKQVCKKATTASALSR